MTMETPIYLIHIVHELGGLSLHPPLVPQRRCHARRAALAPGPQRRALLWPGQRDLCQRGLCRAAQRVKSPYGRLW